MKPTPIKSANKRINRRYGDGRASFLGRLEAVQRWIDEGRTLRSYYDDHADVLEVSYSQFVRHARTFLHRKIRRPANGDAAPSPAREKETKANQTTSSQESFTPPQFRHNAESSSKDELI